jgi:hypothetical protein
MTFSRASHCVYGPSPQAIRREVDTAMAQGSVYATIADYRGGYYLFHSASELQLITPSLLDRLADVANVIVVMLLDGNEVYLLIKQAHFIVGEYRFDNTAVTGNEYKLAATALYVISQQMADFRVYSNATVTVDGTSCRFGDQLTLAVDAEQCTVEDWLDPGALPTTTMVPFKQLALLKRQHRRWPLMGLAASVLMAVVYGLWPVEQSTPVNSQIRGEAPDRYQGLVEHLTKNAGNPLFVLSQVTRRLNHMATLAGWRAFHVAVSQRPDKQFALMVTLSSDSGAVDELMRFAGDHGYVLNVDGERAFLSASLGFMPVLSSAARFQIGSYERLATARLSAWWDGTTTRFVRPPQSEPFIIEKVHIKIPDVDSWDLHSLGSLFYGDPFSLVSLTLTREADTTGRFDADIEMTLAGVMINEVG